MRVSKLQAICLSCVLSNVLFCRVYAQSTTSSEETSALRALVEEIRLLRRDLGKATLHTQHSQLIVERLRIQQERADRIARAVENARNELHELELQDSALEERLKEVSEGIQSDPARRVDVENELKSVRQTLSLQRQREEELRRRESQLSANLRDEQAKVDDLEKRLDALESELDRALQTTNR
jgi:uncharacterized protein YhaN